MAVLEIVRCPGCHQKKFIEYIPKLFLKDSFYLCLSCGCEISIETMKKLKEQEKLENIIHVIRY